MSFSRDCYCKGGLKKAIQQDAQETNVSESDTLFSNHQGIKSSKLLEVPNREAKHV